MLVPATDLSRYAAQLKDEKFALKDVYFTSDSWLISQVLIDLGGWFNSDTALLSAATISDVSTEDRTVTFDIDKAAVEKAPRYDNDTGSPLDLTSLPPIIVGPFGETHSPWMMAAAARRAETDRTDAEVLPTNSYSMTDIKDTPVFGRDGEAGRLIDLVCDPLNLNIMHLVIDTGKTIAERQLVLPTSTFRHFADGDTHMLLNMSVEDIHQAPEVQSLDTIDRHWLDTARTYYALPL